MMLRRTHSTLLTTLIFSLALLTGCGGGSSSDDSNPNPNPPPVITNSEGVLLDGAATSLAINATVDRMPVPISPTLIKDGLLTTRLIGVLDYNATVEQVNNALTDNGATIVSMTENQGFVSLAIDPVENIAEARTKAQMLIDTSAFIYARPGLQTSLVIEEFSGQSSNNFKKISLQPQTSFQANARAAADDYAPHVLSSRFPAAWNLSRAASHDASLINMSAYFRLELIGQYDQLPLFSFPIETLAGETPDYEYIDPEAAAGPWGNLGYHFLGVAAGELLYDGTQNAKLGADPVAIQYLDAFGYSYVGVDEIELLNTIISTWPSLGNTVVLVDGTYNDPDQVLYRHIDRAWSGIWWRIFMSDASKLGVNPIFVTPSGTVKNNTTPDDVAFNSGVAVATLPNIQALAYSSINTTTEEQQAFLDFYDEVVGFSADYSQPLNNVLFVGSSDSDGNESSFSWPGAQVRAVGENVVGPCVYFNTAATNTVCDSNTHTVTDSSTMSAAAQVAGLAAYLWHVDNQLSPNDLVLRLQHAYSSSDISGVIDAWTALLSLDTALTNAPLRTVLLDVSGGGGQPDGVFDEHDVNAFLNAFESFEGAITPDWSVYDLNADGWTNGANGARMDLDVNNLPSFSVVKQDIDGIEKSFNESSVKDVEVLCYYAYSSLYAGDVEDIPTIPDCQAPPLPVELVQIIGNSTTVIDSYGTLAEEYVQEEDPGIVLTYTVTSTASMTDNPDFAGASGQAVSSQELTTELTPTGTVVLNLGYTGSASANVSHSGFTGATKQIQALSASRITTTILLNEVLNYTLTGTITGSGSGLGGFTTGYGDGGGEAVFDDLNGSNGFIFIDAFDSDDNPVPLEVNQSGTLQPGFYRISVNTSAGAASAGGNTNGGSYFGSGQGEMNLVLTRP